MLCTSQAFLANEDLGDSQDSVEALMKKHEDFEKSLAAQEEKIKSLDEFAAKLIENEHYASEEVSARRNSVRHIWHSCVSKTVIGSLFS